MLHVKIKYRKDTREASLLLSGHAGQAEAGRDIVCASASILAYTAAQIVAAMESHGDLTSPPTVKLDSGNAEISCVSRNDDTYAELLYMLFVIGMGYKLLAKNYPQYIELTIDAEA